MAVRGQKLKQGVIAAILQAFPDNCFYDESKKEMRFEGIEDGERVQIKISFTAAKDIVERDIPIQSTIDNNTQEQSIEYTEQEKKETEFLLKGLKGKI